MVQEDVGDTGFILRPDKAGSPSGEPVSKKPRVKVKIDLDGDVAGPSSKSDDALSVDLAPVLASPIQPEVTAAGGSTEESEKTSS
jgi:hypothetical protein